MIGIALVTFVSVLANGIRVSNSDAIERQIQSDLIVTSQDGYSEFPAAVGDAVAGGGVALVSNVRQEIAQVDGDGGNLTGLDERINEVYELRWEQGSDAVAANLGADGAIVPNNVAEDKDLAVGDPVTVRSMDNETREFVVRGIYEGSRSTRCSGRSAFLRPRSTSCTRVRGTASRSSTSRATQARLGRASRAHSTAIRTHDSSRGRSGSRRRTTRSSSSSCSCTCCSRCR